MVENIGGILVPETKRFDSKQAIIGLAISAILIATPLYVYKPGLDTENFILLLIAGITMSYFIASSLQQLKEKKFENLDYLDKAIIIALLTVIFIEAIILTLFFISPNLLGIKIEQPENPKISSNYGLAAENYRKAILTGNEELINEKLKEFEEEQNNASEKLEEECKSDEYKASELCLQKSKAVQCHKKIVSALAELGKQRSQNQNQTENCKSVLSKNSLAECVMVLEALGLPSNYFNNLCSQNQSGDSASQEDNVENPQSYTDKNVEYDPNEGKSACTFFNGYFCELEEICPGNLLDYGSTDRCCEIPCVKKYEEEINDYNE
jgi:hypothetical protein